MNKPFNKTNPDCLLAQNIILANGGVLGTRYNGLPFEMKDGQNRKTVYADTIQFIPGHKTEFVVTVLLKSYLPTEKEDLEKIWNYIKDNFKSPDKRKVSEEELRFRVLLRRLNLSFIVQHGDLTENDFELIEKYRKAVESERRFSDKKIVPLPGDIVEGAYYNNKHPFKAGAIESCTTDGKERKIHICAEPYTPWIYLKNDNTVGIQCSGGPFFSFNSNELEYAGTDTRLICDWGHAGVCANGSVRFPVCVNRWRIKKDVEY